MMTKITEIPAGGEVFSMRYVLYYVLHKNSRTIKINDSWTDAGMPA